MKELITLYSLRYGIEDTLTLIAEGLKQASQEVSSMTEFGKRIYLDTSTKILQIRNEIRKQL